MRVKPLQWTCAKVTLRLKERIVSQLENGDGAIVLDSRNTGSSLSC